MNVPNRIFLTLSLGICFYCAIDLRADDKPTYDLYAAFMLTGVGANFGSVELNGANLAVEEFNQSDELDGKKVKLVVEDTHGNNLQALSAVRKLISLYKTNVILGPTWLDSFQSALPIADKEKIFLFTPSAAVPVFKKSADQYKFVFSTWFSLDVEIEKLLRFMKSKNVQTIILAFDQDPFFQTMRAIISGKVSSLDMNIVLDESFDMGTADFRSMLAKIKKFKSSSVIFGFGDETNLLTFLKQRKILAPAVALYGTDYLDGYVSQEQWRVLFDNVEYIAPQVHDKRFVLTYQNRFAEAPVLSASTSYDATRILLKALKANKRTAEDLRAYLLNNEFDTATFGRVRFNELGGVQTSQFVIKQVNQGHIKEQLIED